MWIDASRMDHRRAALGQPLVVPGRAAGPHQPSEGPLHHPATRQHAEAALIERLADQLQQPAAEGPGPDDRRLVGRVGPDQPPPRQPASHPRQQELDAVAVLDARRVGHDGHHRAQGVDQEGALAAGHPLARVGAPLAPLGRLDRLAVDARGRGALLAAVGAADAGPHDVQDLLPRAVEPPPAIGEGDRPPGGQVVGHEPPGDAGLDQVEDAVEDLAEVDRAGPAAGLGLGQQRLDGPPLLVGQVGGIGFAFHA